MKTLLALAMAVLLSGCITGEVIGDVRPGMAQEQVESILGKPDTLTVRGDYTVLTYANRLISGWSWNRTNFHVILKNDQVVEAGSGIVREKNPNKSTHTVFLETE